MNKKALIIAGTASMISQFNLLNIEVLKEYDYDVEIACDFVNGNNIDDKEKLRFKNELKDNNIAIHQIDFSRNFLNIFGHIKAYKQIKKLKDSKHYDLVHCHMPISAFLTKLAFKNEKTTRVIYTAHGFHFFKGSPLINWLIYYPLEKISSKWIDTLMVINNEDYKLAKERLLAKKVYLTPSIGVDIDRFSNCEVNKKEIISKYNIPDDAFILLSVGELIRKKNHISVLKALSKLNNKNIYFLLVGIGKDKVKLENAVHKLHLKSNVRFLNYQKEIEKLYHVSDCLIHIPFREGLGMAPLEAMASGKPLITSYINGIKDYTENGVSGICVNPNSIDEIAKAISIMYDDADFRYKCSNNNIKTVEKYGKNKVRELLEEVYK